MPIDFACVHVSSVLWNALGGALTVILSTRGTDTDGVPSVFFFEITLARILLCATWAVVHLLYSFFNESRVADMVVPNAILDATRAVVLSSQFMWHRHWSTGDGWKLLRTRFVRPTLWRWLHLSQVITGIGAILNSTIVWHHPGEAQYIINVVFQCLSYTGSVLILYFMRHYFIRGSIWLLLCVGCVWNGAISGLALLVSVLVHSVPIPDPYGFLGQSAFSWVLAMIGYRLHTEVLHSIESPLNSGAPKPRPIAIPLEESSEFGASMSIVSVAPFNSAGGEGEMELAASPASPSLAWEESAPSAPMAPPPVWQMPPASTEEDDLSSHVARVSAQHQSVLTVSESIQTRFAASDSSGANLKSDIPSDLDDESIIAPPDVVQMHKLIVSVVELFVFTGTAYASESFVRLGFPALKFCDQFDPMRASWLEFVQSIFDLLSA
jgi:hypothetical protein